MSVVQQIGDRIAALTVAEAQELNGYLKSKYGIEPAGGAVVQQQLWGDPNPNIQQEAPAATEFNVVLTGFEAAKKIGLIKVVRELTGQGLAEAKQTVEGGEKTIKQSVDKKTADDLKAKLETEGAKIEVRPA